MSSENKENEELKERFCFNVNLFTSRICQYSIQDTKEYCK